MGIRGGFFGKRNVVAATATVPFVKGFRMAFNANMNQEIIRAKAIIAELRSNNEMAHQLSHTLKTCSQYKGYCWNRFTGHRACFWNVKQVYQLPTRRIANELDNLAIEVQNMKRLKRW